MTFENSNNKLNIMNPTYIKKLAICVRQTTVKAQKIDKFYSNNFKITIIDFLFNTSETSLISKLFNSQHQNKNSSWYHFSYFQ